jgi:hypothetical protein
MESDGLEVRRGRQTNHGRKGMRGGEGQRKKARQGMGGRGRKSIAFLNPQERLYVLLAIHIDALTGVREFREMRTRRRWESEGEQPGRWCE